MSPMELLSQPIWQRLGWSLLHFLWQALAVAALTMAGVRLLNLRHGPQRYAAYLAALLIMAACPVATFLTIELPGEPAPVARVALDERTPLDGGYSAAREVGRAVEAADPAAGGRESAVAASRLPAAAAPGPTHNAKTACLLAAMLACMLAP